MSYNMRGVSLPLSSSRHFLSRVIRSPRILHPGPVSRAAALLFVLLLGAGQARALDPSKALTQYTHDAWTTEADLPQTSVQAIVQTRDGYLWLGTQEGLVRFDGVRFTQMNAEDISALFEDRDGTLWIGSYAGVQSFQSGRFKRYTTAEGLSSNRVNDICQDTSGALWFATNLGVSRLSDGRFSTLTLKDGLPSDEVTTIVETRGGAVWAGTQRGLCRIEGGRTTVFTNKDGLPKDSIAKLFEDSQGTLWIGTNGGGLVACRKGRFTTYGLKDGLPSDEIKALGEDRDGSLWIGSETGGLTRMRQGRFDTYSTKEGLSDNAVWSLCEDREGSLWVGTFGGGLNRFKDEKLTTYDSSVGLSNNTAWAVYEDSADTLWVGTDGGLNAYKGGKFTAYTTKNSGLPHDSVPSILEDRDGILWVGTAGGGLARFKDGRFSVFAEKEGLTYPNVFSLCEDRSGALWIGTNGGGLFRLENGKLTSFKKRDGLSDEYIRSLLEDREGNLWIGTNGGGLNRYAGGKFTAYSVKEGLPSNFIRALYQDRQGTLWIGTRGGGLCRMRDGKFQVFGTKDGLLSDVAFQILEDGRENLWVSCNKGIFRVSKRDLEDFAAGKIPRIACVSYGRADGMKSPECNGGTQPAGWKTRDGRLWFPTIRGVVAIDPQRLATNEVPPPVLVESVLVDGKPLSAPATGSRSAGVAPPGQAGDAPPGPAGEAPPGSDRFEFHFTALSFLAPDRVRFQYFLEGYDKGWNDLGGGRERVAVYTNLPPGKYTFRVKACNNDGLWNETGAAFPFRLRPQFHQTPLFTLLVVLALLLLGGTLYHFAGIALENLRVGRSLARYHSRQVIEKLRTTKGAGGSLVASERRRLTILFSDITGFSDYSDRNEPEVVDRIINEYLTEMAALLEGQSGTVARFMGDGIMAFFGAPAEMEPAEQARRAVAAAVAMQRRMGELGRKWLDQGHDHDLKMRVGISQDYATVGNFGSKDLMEYTALGSAVNLAARLETGCTPGRILVSFAVYMATRDRFPYSPPEEREFKGFSGALHVAELDPDRSEKIEPGNRGAGEPEKS